MYNNFVSISKETVVSIVIKIRKWSIDQSYIKLGIGLLLSCTLDPIGAYPLTLVNNQEVI